MLNDSTIARQQYTLSTGTDALSFDFYVLDADHITVWNDPADGSTPSKLVKDTDYSVSGTGDEEGNVTVTMIGQAASDKITVLRVPTMDQLLDLVFNGKIYEDSLEQGLDKLTMICLAIQEQVERCLQLPPYEADGWISKLDEAADRIGKLIRFDENGDMSFVTEFGDWEGEWVTATAYQKYDLLKDPATNNVYMVLLAHTSTSVAADLAADKLYLLIDAASTASDAAAAAASAAAAAASEAAAATSETNAATSESNASASASAAATSESNAATSESNAATSASASSASASAAATSETNAATSETNAATSAANAATSETNAATSETNAATSASEAATSAAILDSVANNLDYQGNHDASGNTAPSSPSTGEFWTISAAGTFGSISWSVGDLALYDGSAWHNQDIDSIIQQETNDRKAALNPKAFAGGVALGGTEGYADFTQSPTAVSALMLDVFAADTSQSTHLYGTNTSSTYAFGSLEERFWVAPGGDLKYRLYNTSPNFNEAVWSAVISEGVWQKIALVNEGDGSTPTLYIDGVAQSAPTTSSAGTPPGWDFDRVATYATLGRTYNGVTGGKEQMRNLALFNNTLTATQTQEIYGQGVRAWLAANPEYKWGSPTEGSTYTSDFSVDVDGWNDQGVGLIASVASTLELTASVAGVAGASQPDTLETLGLEDGDIVSIAFSHQYISGSTGSGNLEGKIQSLGGGILPVNKSFYPSSTLARTVFVTTLTDASLVRSYFRFATFAADDVVQFSNVTITKLGCLTSLPMDEGIGYQLHDDSPNHYDALLSETGFEHLQPKREGFIRDFNVDAYNGGSGDVELVNSSRDILPVGAIITGSFITNKHPTLAIGDLLFDLQISNRTLHSIIGENKNTVDPDKSILIYVGESRRQEPLTYNNVSVSGGVNSTNVDIRVNYETLD